MTEKEKLNEKLAKFAGFKFQELEDLLPKYRHEANRHWIYPTGEYNHQLPDFTNDPNACFKWLLPDKVSEVVFTYYDNGVDCWILANGQDFSGWVDAKSKKDAVEKSAPALCLAIEKLIDSSGGKK